MCVVSMALPRACLLVTLESGIKERASVGTHSNDRIDDDDDDDACRDVIYHIHTQHGYSIGCSMFAIYVVLVNNIAQQAAWRHTPHYALSTGSFALLICH